MAWPCLGLRLLVLALGTAGEPLEKKPVPVYTNDDLDRVAPFRDETGVNSSGASRPRTPSPARGADEGAAKSEAYWRREAAKLRARQQRTRDRVANLRSRVATVEAQSGPRSGEARARGTALVEMWRGHIATLEARLREEDGEFADRARRAGALPGWLR